jgi:hypothetical protein
MLTTGMDNRARSGMACTECNDLLVAPKWSAYVSNREVRHVWSCENCGHEIEMAVNLRVQNLERKKLGLGTLMRMNSARLRLGLPGSARSGAHFVGSTRQREAARGKLAAGSPGRVQR